MTSSAESAGDRQVVAAQLGRVPREPWRVGSRCAFGYPTAIVSPSVLADGTPFPSLAWLTCPWLAEEVGARESVGMISQWTETVGRDEAFAAQLDRADREMRIARSQESDGNDACAPLGIAGQRDPSNVKCLHAHVALSLTGVDDPIGRVLLDEIGSTCADSRCVRFAAGTERA